MQKEPGTNSLAYEPPEQREKAVEQNAWGGAFSLWTPSHLVIHVCMHSSIHSFIIPSVFIEHGAKEGFVSFYFI